MKVYDAIVIGGGHNGLVAACYLAKAGRKVLVLERRHIVGGASITEEIVPGFKFSRLAYVNSLFRPEIIEDLKLKDFGFELLRRDPSSFTPFPDGRHLFLGPDQEMTVREIAKFSQKDAEAYPRYERLLEKMVEVIEPTLDRPPPELLFFDIRSWFEALGLARRARSLGKNMYRLAQMMTGPATTMLDEWFESEELKTTLATDAIIGAMASPATAGTAYVLFHHVMGETNGDRGVWAYVRGGMGKLSEAIAASARSLGVEIRTSAPVAQFMVEGKKAKGVVLEDGTEIGAKLLLSNADPNVTFRKLCPQDALPEEFRQQVGSIDYSSAVFKLNLALSSLPNFTACPGSEPGPQHRGTIHISPTMAFIEEAYHDAIMGRTSRRPVLECTIPSVVDDTIAPPGQHVMSMFVQYAPYKLAEGHWDEEKHRFADTCIGLLDEYAPGFRESVIAYDAISPLDLEREFSMTGGNIFHGAMTPNQMFFLRPVGGYARYRSPIKGLYMCGAGAHPGGGVLGACGRNGARAALKDGY